ncbi:MAG: peptide chain release factor N(5)-glutamine methyltransferase [Bacteroidetes bacterium]|nr:peptide chain release factor N(5)-glutamine methyltransferase [Bacteroidota bacterium]
MATNHSIKKVISEIKSELSELYPVNEIDSFIFLIFDHLLGISRTQLLLSKENEINEGTFLKINNIISELKSYRPIQYILGETEFYDLKFKVFDNILIPRPETEELVDWIIKDHSNTSIKILDIGTGSGCIAVSLAKNMPNAVVYASDISELALKAAETNSKINNTSLHLLQFDILNPPSDQDKKFDIIVSNPPYVTEKEKSLMQQNVLDYEPELALFVPDNDPLLFYRSILDFGLQHLKPKGNIYFEINEAFGQEMISLMQKKGFSDNILLRDINGKDRMVRGIKNS